MTSKKTRFACVKEEINVVKSQKVVFRKSQKLLAERAPRRQPTQNINRYSFNFSGGLIVTAYRLLSASNSQPGTSFDFTAFSPFWLYSLKKMEWIFTLFVTDVTPWGVTSVITSFGVNIEWTGRDSTRWVVNFHSTGVRIEWNSLLNEWNFFSPRMEWIIHSILLESNPLFLDMLIKDNFSLSVSKYDSFWCFGF